MHFRGFRRAYRRELELEENSSPFTLRKTCKTALRDLDKADPSRHLVLYSGTYYALKSQPGLCG